MIVTFWAFESVIQDKIKFPKFIHANKLAEFGISMTQDISINYEIKFRTWFF